MSFSKNSWWHYLWLKEQWFLLAFILLNLIISSIFGYLTPLWITDFYQSLKSDADFDHHLRWLIFLFVGEYLNRFFFQISTHRYIQHLLNEVRRRSFSIWLKSPFKKVSGKKHEDYPMGEVLARLMNDTDAVREVVTSGSFAIFIDIIFILFCLISFLRLNSSTGVALFIAEILACWLLLRGSKVMAKVFMDVRKVTGQLSRSLTDLTAGLRELFFTPNKNYASKRGEKAFDEFLKKQLEANVWDAGYYSAAESLYPILVALVMIIVPYSSIVEVAILAALIDLIQKSITPIKDVASKISVIQRARTGIERLQQFDASFDSQSFQRPDYFDLKVENFHFHLKEFSYEEGFALNEIEFNLKRGEVLGILGESGCGKSTLLKLLSGQYQSFEGEIIIDGKKISTSNEFEFRGFSSFVSLISQDSHVFSETLRFNITLGVEQNFEDFWSIANKSIPYLERSALALDKVINPKELSMGQKQLISGLRALYLKKPIILMDEISSGLDSDLEAALRDLVKFFQMRSMTIIVTHRLETIMGSDQLLLLDKGRLEAKGSPEELAEVPLYRSFLEHLKT